MQQQDAPAMTAATLTRDEANDILARGYPTSEQLRRFPLGDVLASIPAVDRGYTKHIETVFEGVNVLLSKSPQAMLRPSQSVEDARALGRFVDAYG